MTNLSDTHEETGAEYAIKFRRPGTESARKPRSDRATLGRRRGKTPQQYNGIHRRRRKKIRW